MSQPKVIKAYRTLFSLVQRLPNPQRKGALKQLRQEFRRHATEAEENIPGLLKVADDKAAFLRIVTVKDRSRDGAQKSQQRYVYRDGKKEEDGDVTRIDIRAKNSNWDGKNLDPCSVKRHYGGLKSMGFKNNLHAKGIF
eukprot:CAMPEP_0172497180 /NCGR_PEP_ID=MMETSP1066-20121228/96290_1 /TAXON_ID=671091 /ORGANISM="Coscinodiscus wailesii, Strain CCMP2513" /LENGTH=138 /DNA_ID=CAMNT_0013269807 /DNA_START=120 /DNA_END=536 /DNA_ORIENTATION=-